MVSARAATVSQCPEAQECHAPSPDDSISLMQLTKTRVNRVQHTDAAAQPVIIQQPVALGPGVPLPVLPVAPAVAAYQPGWAEYGAHPQTGAPVAYAPGSMVPNMSMAPAYGQPGMMPPVAGMMPPVAGSAPMGSPCIPPDGTRFEETRSSSLYKDGEQYHYVIIVGGSATQTKVADGKTGKHALAFEEDLGKHQAINANVEKFAGGSPAWCQGLSRSATVTYTTGPPGSLSHMISANEPSKCVYEFAIEVDPSLCSSAPPLKGKNIKVVIGYNILGPDPTAAPVSSTFYPFSPPGHDIDGLFVPSQVDPLTGMAAPLPGALPTLPPPMISGYFPAVPLPTIPPTTTGLPTPYPGVPIQIVVQAPISVPYAALAQPPPPTTLAPSGLPCDATPTPP